MTKRKTTKKVKAPKAPKVKRAPKPKKPKAPKKFHDPHITKLGIKRGRLVIH